MTEPETSTPTNPLEQLLALLGTIDPIDLAGKAVDVTRKTTDSLLTILENFASTVDNLNKTTSRINTMLDEIEEIIRRNHWGLDLRWVESDGNVAHSATHDETLTGYRINRTWKLSVEEEYSEPEGGRGKRDIDGNLM